MHYGAVVSTCKLKLIKLETNNNKNSVCCHHGLQYTAFTFLPRIMNARLRQSTLPTVGCVTTIGAFIASFTTYQPVIKNRNDLSRLKGEFIVFHCLKVIQGSDFLHLNLKVSFMFTVCVRINGSVYFDNAL